MKLKKLEKCDISSKTERRTQHEKVVEEDQRKSVHDEFFVMAFMVYAANTRCAWTGHQPKMLDEIRKFKRS